MRYIKVARNPVLSKWNLESKLTFYFTKDGVFDVVSAVSGEYIG